MSADRNKVETDAEIVEVSLCGKQDRESVIRLGKQATTEAEKLPRALILIDLRKYERANTLEVRKAVFETFSTMTYDRLALFGGDRVSANLISLLSRAAQRRDSIRHFASRDEAAAWLKE